MTSYYNPKPGQPGGPRVSGGAAGVKPVTGGPMVVPPKPPMSGTPPPGIMKPIIDTFPQRPGTPGFPQISSPNGPEVFPALPSAPRPPQTGGPTSWPALPQKPQLGSPGVETFPALPQAPRPMTGGPMSVQPMQPQTGGVMNTPARDQLARLLLGRK